MSAIRIAFIAADFNKDIVNPMISAAEEECSSRGIEILETVRVPGSYEIPLIADTLLQREDIDLLVVLGHIDRGETLHGEVMGHVVHRSLIDLELKYSKVIGIGIIGPGATVEQAEVRKLGYAKAAVEAAVRNYENLLEVQSGR